MDKKPIISVVIPCFNVEKYLKKALKSVLKQKFSYDTSKYTGLEIICVDDCSTDKTLKVISKFASRYSNIRIVSLPKNSGPSVCRNAGICEANGEFIAFVDSDDWIEKGTFQKALNAMEDDVDLVYWNVRVVKSRGIFYYKQVKEWFDKVFYLGKRPLNDFMFLNFTPECWSKFFRLSLIKDKNVSFPEGFIHEDFAFLWKYLVWCRNVVCLDEKLYNYYQRKYSIVYKMKTKEVVNFDKFYVCDDIFNYLKKYQLFDRYKDIFKLFFEKMVDSMLWDIDDRKKVFELRDEFLSKWKI